MGYSIFEDTMADMTWVEIDEASKEKAIILFPLGVIEEHGPHLCLGTDIYQSYYGCRIIRKQLESIGIKTLISPPYYWGINNVTGAFPGSFTVRKETLINMIYDILGCLQRWGFDNVFCFYGHGDKDHFFSILDAIKKARIDTKQDVKMVVEGFNLARFGLTGKEEYILSMAPPLPEPYLSSVPELYDIHAGAIETATMVYYFPELVKTNMVKSLKSTELTGVELNKWSKGWDETRKLTPLGYAGNPADYIKHKNIDKETEFICEFAASCIKAYLDKR